MWVRRALALWCAAAAVACAAGYTVDCNSEYTDCDTQLSKIAAEIEETMVKPKDVEKTTSTSTTDVPTRSTSTATPTEIPMIQPLMEMPVEGDTNKAEPRLLEMNVAELQNFANALHNRTSDQEKKLPDLSDVTLDSDEETRILPNEDKSKVEISDKFYSNLQEPFSPMLMPEHVDKTPEGMEMCMENDLPFKVGDMIQRGCEEVCQCMSGGMFDCSPRCKHPYIRRGRRLNDPLCFESVVDECCSIVACATGDQKSAQGPGTTCKYGNDTHPMGSTWHDACKFTCKCEKNGVVNCRPRCQPLPQSDKCINVQDPKDECCEVQICDVSQDVHEEPVDNVTTSTSTTTAKTTILPRKTTMRPLVLKEPIGSIKVLQNNSVQVNLIHPNDSYDPIHLLLSRDGGMTFEDVELTYSNLILNLQGGKNYVLKTKETGTNFNFTITSKNDDIGCYRNGKHYAVGEEFQIGCTELCECTGPNTHECAALVCPTHVGLELISRGCVQWAPNPPAEPPNCCPRTARCLSDGTCHFNGVSIPNWSEVPISLTGCERRCFCENGELDCQDVCSALPPLPPQNLRCPPMHRPAPVNISDDDCCKKWGCLPILAGKKEDSTFPNSKVTLTNLVTPPNNLPVTFKQFDKIIKPAPKAPTYTHEPYVHVVTPKVHQMSKLKDKFVNVIAPSKNYPKEPYKNFVTPVPPSYPSSQEKYPNFESPGPIKIPLPHEHFASFVTPVPPSDPANVVLLQPPSDVYIYAPFTPPSKNNLSLFSANDPNKPFKVNRPTLLVHSADSKPEPYAPYSDTGLKNHMFSNAMHKIINVENKHVDLSVKKAPINISPDHRGGQLKTYPQKNVRVETNQPKINQHRNYLPAQNAKTYKTPKPPLESKAMQMAVQHPLGYLNNYFLPINGKSPNKQTNPKQTNLNPYYEINNQMKSGASFKVVPENYEHITRAKVNFGNKIGVSSYTDMTKTNVKSAQAARTQLLAKPHNQNLKPLPVGKFDKPIGHNAYSDFPTSYDRTYSGLSLERLLNQMEVDSGANRNLERSADKYQAAAGQTPTNYPSAPISGQPAFLPTVPPQINFPKEEDDYDQNNIHRPVNPLAQDLPAISPGLHLPPNFAENNKKLTVISLQSDSPTSVKLLFGLPPVLVGLRGSVDLRYTEKEDEEDVTNWYSQVFAPADEILTTPRLEFRLTGLKPSTIYKIRGKLYLHNLPVEPESSVYTVRTQDLPTVEPIEEKRREVDSRLALVSVNDSTAQVTWRHFTEDELQFIDGIQVRYRPVGTPIYSMTELLHHSRTVAELLDLRPGSRYEASLVLIPPPRATIELHDPGHVEFTTSPYVDIYNWSVNIEARTVGAEAAELTWHGVPSPAERWVRVYRAAHACSGERKEHDAFRLAARDSPPSLVLSGLEPDTRCRVWLELFLTNGKIKTSNVLEINTQSLDSNKPIDNEIEAASVSGSRSGSRGDYYGALVVVGVVAALGALTSLLLLLVVVRRHRPRSVAITSVPTAPRESSLPPYDNPAYKLELQQETMDL